MECKNRVNAVVLNAVGRRNTQMSTKERKRKSAKERKGAQKGAKEHKRVLPRKKLHTTRFETAWELPKVAKGYRNS